MLVSRHIPSLINGVSQQPPTLRAPSQNEAQVNAYATVKEGWKKRPPSQHLARLVTADYESAFVHAINRDTSERYIVVITDGDLKVFDTVDGAEQTVNFPTGKDYLDVVGSATDGFAVVTIADYSFIVNKEVVVASKTAATTTPTNYNDLHYPGTWGERDIADFISSGGTLGGSLDGTVNTFSDLPKASDSSPPSEGDLYKVVGSDTNNFAGYYVVRKGGVWVETYGPSANQGLDETTMPHALVREANDTFTFTPFGWKVRKYGDAKTNPHPTFVGSVVNDVFYWKNRLGFVSDENVILSAAGDYGNFYRNTMTTLLDSDVIDVAVSSTKVSLLKFALPFANNMMLFSDQTQFQLNVTDIVTPASVSIDEVTSFEMSPNVRPAAIGTDIYFASPAGGHSRVREYFVQEDSIVNDASDITAHVPRYIPSKIREIDGNSNEDVLVCLSSKAGEKNRLYVYKFHWSGDQKIQSSWNYWEFDANDTILSMTVIESQVFIVVKRADGAYLEKIDLDENSQVTDKTYDILLDRRYAVQPGDISYNVGLNETTFTVPWDTANCTRDNVKVVLTEGVGNDGRLLPQSGYTFPVESGNNEITVPGDWRNTVPFIGVNYEALNEFSEQFVYDNNGNALTSGRLQLRTFNLYFEDSGFFQVKVYPYGRSFTADVESVVPSALDAFTGRTLGEAQLAIGEAGFSDGVYTVYIDGNSSDVVVQLINPSHLQAKFSSVEWEGMFFKRSRSM